MKTLSQILEKININREVSKQGRHNPDREMPSSAVDTHLNSKPDLRARRRAVRTVSRLFRQKIYDSSKDTLQRNRTKAISNKTMRITEAKRTQFSAILHGPENEHKLTQIYAMRKAGATEREIGKALGGSRQLTPATIFHNADAEENFSRSDYHSPNTHHPSLPDHIIAHIYSERSKGRSDGKIARNMFYDDKFHRTINTSELRYNVDHPHVIKKAISKDFQEKHGTGYVPPNDAVIPGKSVPKYPVSDSHLKKVKQYAEKNPNATSGELRRAAGIPRAGHGAFLGALKRAGIQPEKGMQKTPVDTNSDFHKTLHSMIHDEGMTNREIVDASEKRLGRYMSKGAVLGYIHRTGIGPNPNRDKIGNPNWGKYDRKKRT